MSSIGKLRLVAACTAALFLGILVAVALASHTLYPSKVTITKTSPVFAGKVKSNSPDCIVGRTVKLHVVERENHVVGTDTANQNGEWRIDFQGQKTAHYFASVPETRGGPPGMIFVCRHDTSPTIAAP